MSAGKPPLREFQNWGRKRVPKPNGELAVALDPTSNDTNSSIKLESPAAIAWIQRLGDVVKSRITGTDYVKAIQDFMIRRDASLAEYGPYYFERGSIPTTDDYAVLIREIRQEFPGLAVSRDRMLSDAGLKDVIYQVWLGRFFPASIYRKEVSRSVETSKEIGTVPPDYSLSPETVKTYCKPSKPSRQKKQINRGRPRKEHPPA
jgi:hypothetical protein